MKRIAIIPARGGSKRIPRKNIKLFHGKPIIAYAIETAIQSKLFDAVYVSTDDAEIAQIAKKHGAEVPFMRSEGNSSDFATTVDVLKEFLGFLSKTENIDIACCIYPTSPLLSCSTLQKGFVELTENKRDTVITVSAYSTPIQRALQAFNGKIDFIHPEHLNTRSQDLETSFFDAGQCYWFLPKLLTEQNKLITQNTGFVELSSTEVQDIDSPDDWTIAELKYQMLHQ